MNLKTNGFFRTYNYADRRLPMSPELTSSWPQVKRFFAKSIQSSHFYTFATVNRDGSPHLAPYASLILNDDCTGYYSDVFPDKTSRNLKADPRICISAVRMDFRLWFTGLLSGKFANCFGIRLYGTVGPSRKADSLEIDRWRCRVKRYKWMKGYNPLWGNVRTVRDIQFDRFEPLQMGRMSQGQQII